MGAHAELNNVFYEKKGKSGCGIDVNIELIL